MTRCCDVDPLVFGHHVNCPTAWPGATPWAVSHHGYQPSQGWTPPAQAWTPE